MIKINFEFDTSYGKFVDALNLPDDHSFTEEEIQLMKEQRRDNWIATINNSINLSNQVITKEINGEIYKQLDGDPPNGAKLIEIDGNYFYKV